MMLDATGHFADPYRHPVERHQCFKALVSDQRYRKPTDDFGNIQSMIQMRMADDNGLKFTRQGFQVSGNLLTVHLRATEEHGCLADPGEIGIDKPGLSFIREFQTGGTSPANGYHTSSP